MLEFLKTSLARYILSSNRCSICSLLFDTRDCRYQGMIKGYSGVFRLGEATSTWDADSPVSYLFLNDNKCSSS